MAHYKYAVLPGYVKSKSDGQTHWIGFLDLCRLYKVNPSLCLDLSREHNRATDPSDLVFLYPSEDGNYRLTH